MLKKITSFIPLRYKVLLCMGILIFTPLVFQEWSGKSMNIPIVLEEGFETEWAVWRPIDTRPVHLEMAFPRMQNTILETYSNGEHVRMSLTLNGKTCIFEQNRGLSARSENTIYQNLHPVMHNCIYLYEIAGQNHWHIKVILVGDKLRATQARLLGTSPYGSFKSIPHGAYGKIMQFNLFLGWFIAPIFVLWVFLQVVYDLLIRHMKVKQTK